MLAADLESPACDHNVLGDRNIDFDLHRARPSGAWHEDVRLGASQVNSEYRPSLESISRSSSLTKLPVAATRSGTAYARGAVARTSLVSWGTSDKEADEAVHASMCVSNALPLHEQLISVSGNASESTCCSKSTIRQPETAFDAEHWVRPYMKASTSRVSVFAGPVYGTRGSARRFIDDADSSDLVEVPAAIFKIVAFVDKKGRIASRAFIYVQDPDALPAEMLRCTCPGSKEAYCQRSAAKGRAYQVSVQMIEVFTGLVFPPVVAAANPLFARATSWSVELGTYTSRAALRLTSCGCGVCLDCVAEMPQKVI